MFIQSKRFNQIIYRTFSCFNGGLVLFDVRGCWHVYLSKQLNGKAYANRCKARILGSVKYGQASFEIERSIKWLGVDLELILGMFYKRSISLSL